MKNKISTTFLIVLATFTAVSAQPFDNAKLDQLFDRLAEKKKAMGSLVIAKDGRIVYTRAIGYARLDATTKKPLTVDTRFRIASITKTYTAVMLLQLVEEGKLELTDTLGKFFPQVPNAKKITILQILSHRSGIPNVRPDEATWKPGSPITKDEMLALIVKGTPEFEPDTKSSYSNSGYFLLGLIVEKITGKPYERALEERISSRIGLKDTYLATGPIDVSKGEALTYDNNGQDWELWRNGFETHASIARQLIATPADMAKFITALFDLKLLSRSSLEQMKTLRDGEGLGLVSFTYAGKTFYGNTGGGDNYGSWLMYQPEDKLVVSYTTNAKVIPVEDIIRSIVEIYYGKPFEIPTFDTTTVTTEVLDKYVGIYSGTSAPVKWTVTRDGGTLLVQPGSEKPAPLEATAQDRFQLFGGRVVFVFDAAKNQMTLTRGGQSIVFTKEK